MDKVWEAGPLGGRGETKGRKRGPLRFAGLACASLINVLVLPLMNPPFREKIIGWAGFTVDH